MKMPKSDGRCSRETLIRNIMWIEDLNTKLNIENVVLRKERDELARNLLHVADCGDVIDVKIFELAKKVRDENGNA